VPVFSAVFAKLVLIPYAAFRFCILVVIIGVVLMGVGMYVGIVRNFPNEFLNHAGPTKDLL
jgi:hypothetical protein